MNNKLVERIREPFTEKREVSKFYQHLYGVPKKIGENGVAYFGLEDQSPETQDFIASCLGLQKVNNQEGE